MTMRNTAIKKIFIALVILSCSTVLYAKNSEIIGLSEPERTYIIITIHLMSELNFKIRDTFQPSYNLDDFFSNGRKYNGPRHFKIKWVNDSVIKYAQVEAKRAYKIKNFLSQAYDSYAILVPLKFKEQQREDPIIHECVHFLQHSAQEDERNYKYFNGKNYHEYISQRTELEAHLVQILYMLENDRERIRNHLGKEKLSNLVRLISEFKVNHDNEIGVKIISLCKRNGVI